MVNIESASQGNGKKIVILSPIVPNSRANVDQFIRSSVSQILQGLILRAIAFRKCHLQGTQGNHYNKFRDINLAVYSRNGGLVIYFNN